jgi:hypothetical protein
MIENLSPAVKDLFNKWDKPTNDIFNKWDKPTNERLIIDHPILLSYQGKAAFYQWLHLRLNKPSRLVNWTSAKVVLRAFLDYVSLNVFEKINNIPFLLHIHENRMVAKSFVVPTL